MNYLAHAYLSFELPEILTGNMISDFIKGKKQYDFPPGIQAGIALHRAIDIFTDFHQSTAIAKEIFRPAYRLYAGPFVDIVYDHFLANDTREFAADQLLKQFAAQTYAQLEQCEAYFPSRFAYMFPYMRSHDWLYNYHTMQGIRYSFEGLARRAAFIDESGPAFSLFEKHYDALHRCYDDFFPSLKKFARGHLQLLIEK